jgi:ATP-dependent DNA helicase RecG
MKPSIQKLKKIFKLEAERKYDNHAVVGGLERMLDYWEPEARLDGLPEDLLQAIIARLRDYARLTEKSRAETLQGIWRRIQRSEAGLSTETPFDAESPAEHKPPESPQPAQKTPVAAPPAAAGFETAPETRIEPVETDAAQMAVPEPTCVDEATQPAGPLKLKTLQRPAIPRPAVEPVALNAPITVLQGIGPRNAQNLARVGLHTLRDMLYYFPRRYDDYSKMKPINRLWFGEEVTIIANVQSIDTRPLRGGSSSLVEAVVSDGSGALRVTWFNQPWLTRRLHKGAYISLSGKIDQYLGRLVMTNPDWEDVDQQHLNTGRIVPVYPLTAQVTQGWLRKQMSQLVTFWAPRVQDTLPEWVRRSADLPELSAALLQIHFPDSWDDLKAAQHRLAFDEIFLLQLGVLSQKRQWQNRTAQKYTAEQAWLDDQLLRLPYQLTQAQLRALQDVRHDLASGRPMDRLIQGDVGSGKTVIAGLAIAIVTQQGAQASLMAPTSILAEQHYRSLLKMLATNSPPEPAPAVVESQPAKITVESEMMEDSSEFSAEHVMTDVMAAEVAPAEAATPKNEAAQEDAPEAVEKETAPPVELPPPPLQESEIRLLIGATPENEKREIRDGLADGSIKLVVGTHALIEDPVGFANLGLVIVDEQHRFGVEQRAALRSKGENPHLLVLTATPIPRSLALTVYGDLDLTVMDEMPPGRQPVSTYVLMPRERERAYALIRTQIELGRQAFVIYPLVEESENSEARAAVAEQQRLQKEIYPDLNVGLLHGRMKPDEKEAAMQAFRDRQYHVLVSTTVIEVGVDIPNATVMLVEGANRFGLAQLHQLRGRVGRGSDKAFCLLIPDQADETENERLLVMASTNDGFVLAEKDLEQRGPGQFLGTRQSGYDELHMANLLDVRLIEKARRHAQALFEADPDLQQPENQPLAPTLQRFWDGGKGDIS